MFLFKKFVYYIFGFSYFHFSICPADFAGMCIKKEKKESWKYILIYV